MWQTFQWNGNPWILTLQGRSCLDPNMTELRMSPSNSSAYGGLDPKNTSLAKLARTSTPFAYKTSSMGDHVLLSSPSLDVEHLWSTQLHSGYDISLLSHKSLHEGQSKLGTFSSLVVLTTLGVGRSLSVSIAGRTRPCVVPNSLHVTTYLYPTREGYPAFIA